MSTDEHRQYMFRAIQEEIDRIYTIEDPDEKPLVPKEEFTQRMLADYEVNPSWSLGRLVNVVWWDVHTSPDKKNPFR